MMWNSARNVESNGHVKEEAQFLKKHILYNSIFQKFKISIYPYTLK